MIQLLINNPKGYQEILSISDSGGYFDPSAILWDERTDGPLPEIILGGMVRVDGALQYSQEKMDATTATLLQKAITEKCAEIDALCLEKIQSGVSYTFPDAITGTIMVRDACDMINILSTAVMGIMSAGQEGTFPFIDEGRVVHSLTPEQAMALAAHVFAQKAAIYTASWTMQGTVKALTTVAEVYAYDISSGWPG